MRAYVDSDVLIWHLRGETQAAEFLRELSQESGTGLWVGALQRAEVVFFMRPKRGFSHVLPAVSFPDAGRDTGHRRQGW